MLDAMMNLAEFYANLDVHVAKIFISPSSKRLIILQKFGIKL